MTVSSVHVPALLGSGPRGSGLRGCTSRSQDRQRPLIARAAALLMAAAAATASSFCAASSAPLTAFFRMP